MKAGGGRRKNKQTFLSLRERGKENLFFLPGGGEGVCVGATGVGRGANYHITQRQTLRIWLLHKIFQLALKLPSKYKWSIIYEILT